MLTLPPDLTPDEQATVDALRARAEREARDVAATAIAVRRRFCRLEKRMGREAALDVIAGDPALCVTRATAARIVRRVGRWAA